MDKKQKSNYKEIKKKMKKLTLAEKKQIKEKEKEKQQQKEKQQKITQRVKVNINIPRSIGGSQSSGFSNFPFPFTKDNTEQTSLLKSINEQLKQKNEPKSSNELFTIPSSVMTNPPDLTNRNVISPQRIRNIPNVRFDIPEVRFDIPNVINKPKDTSNFSLDEVVKNKVKEYNENLAMGKEEKDMRDKNEKVKEYNENLAMGKEERRIPLINLPEDTSNLGMLERITEKPKASIENEEGYGLKQSGDDDETKEEKKKVGRKPNTEEYNQQKKIEKEENRLRNNKQITEEAFSRLLTKVDDPAEYKELTELFRTDQLPTKSLKKKLANYGFSKEKIEEIYKNYR
jgi:hypothetical protein